jgi:hypothetical protein
MGLFRVNRICRAQIAPSRPIDDAHGSLERFHELERRRLMTRFQPTGRGLQFTPPSAGMIARDLSEKIEASIVQHCESFTKGQGHCDLCRFDQDWEVKICKDSGLTINQSKVINGENYIVVNDRANSQVVRVWILWEAHDSFFSPRLKNSNARTLNREAAGTNIEVIYQWASPKRASSESTLNHPRAAPRSVAPSSFTVRVPVACSWRS